MSILTSLTNWMAPKTPPTYVGKSWKSGMWVMYQDKIAVIANIAELTEIHYTDKITGENIGIAYVPLEALRQARFPEIPSQRRMVSADKALELGYGP